MSTEEYLVSCHKTASAAQTALVKSTPQLEHCLTNAEANGIPPIAVAPAQGSQLSILCKLVNAKRILEIGTLGGYSTLWFAQSVPGVQVTSIEFNPKHRDVALENLANAGASNVEILLGKALDVLPTLKGEFDFVFIDADWENQDKYFDWAVKLTRKGGCIYVDNVVRQITESEAEGDREQGWRLVETVKKDTRVESTLIPILSTHKKDVKNFIDGYVLATVL